MLPLMLPASRALPESRAANFGLRASGMLTAASAGSQPRRPTKGKRDVLVSSTMQLSRRVRLFDFYRITTLKQGSQKHCRSIGKWLIRVEKQDVFSI